MRKVTGITKMEKALLKLNEAKTLIRESKKKRESYYDDRTEKWQYEERGMIYFDETEALDDQIVDLIELEEEIENWIAYQKGE